MKGIFSEELFLTNRTGSDLYHKYAEHIPIIDYHCHLQPQEIYENKEFEDLGEMWLRGDHYKWRAMRCFGIDEKYITGTATYYEKYMAFASILPRMIGNPIYIWCALELKRYFDIDEPLTENNAQEIYDSTKKMIVEKHMTRRWCMEHSNVELVSTTDDPIDTLEYHLKMKEDPSMKIRVISAFRPDKAMFLEDAEFGSYMESLGESVGRTVDSFAKMLEALEVRLKFFRKTGTTVSDNGIPYFKWEDYTYPDVETIWEKACEGKILTEKECDQYRSAFLIEMGRMYYRNGFVMQMHIGTYLNANTSKVEAIGKSMGFDCTDNRTSVYSVGQFLDRLTAIGELPKLILYPLDGTKIENWAVLAAGFCESGTKAKVQLGAPWWFNDQVFGIHRQFEACANLYPVSLSVGMLTDSRSFISYPRHELYRRVLCDYFGKLVERGEYFGSEDELRRIIEDICYKNVKEFFEFE